jgi:large subunit ribosomal protein L23
VTSVRTQNHRGKERRMGRFAGRKSSWKKAIVTLAEGDAIELYENI